MTLKVVHFRKSQLYEAEACRSQYYVRINQLFNEYKLFFSTLLKRNDKKVPSVV